jgi:NADPH:quinone reductase-like Zn-dependent oxidoreductase
VKAAVYRSYGPPDVLRVEEIDPPALEEGHDDSVLIKVRHASVNPFDCLCRKGYLPFRLSNGLTSPRKPILGIDVAGTVEQVGKKPGKFQVGDSVFGNCVGSYAEYVLARESTLSTLPHNVTFQEAAAIPTAALTALQALRDVAQIKKGQDVLIYGASGGVGHFAVQIAKWYEAVVTAVCSTSNLQWVKNLGADHVIDYTQEDFARSGKKYDIVLDAVAKRTFFACKPSLASTGTYITENPLKPAYHPFQFLLAALTGDRRARTQLVRPNADDLGTLTELIEKGNLKPSIERSYPLTQIAEAHRHIEKGHARGKIVVEIQ